MIKSYRELRRLRTFEERYEYLKLGGAVGRETFGFDRYLNQDFYHNSRDWKLTRRDIMDSWTRAANSVMLQGYASGQIQNYRVT